MSRRELTARLAHKTGLPVRQTAPVLRVLVDLIADELLHGGRLEWRSLGTFSVRSYPARKIHVPATGATIELPARAGVTFKPSKRLLTKLKPKPSARKSSRHLAPKSPTTIAPSPPPTVPAPPPSPRQRPSKSKTAKVYVGIGTCELCASMWPEGWKPTVEGRGLFKCLQCGQELNLGLRFPPMRSDVRYVPRPSSYVRPTPPGIPQGKTKAPAGV
jgi:nucleoid DNA-binding protein